MKQGNQKQLDQVRFVRGSGATLFDENNVAYTDFTCSYGPIILGYADATVNAAVTEQMQRGVLFPYAPPVSDELETALLAIFPQAQGCLFFKTGSEAVTAAMRLARATTGRSRIARCGFVGWHDAQIAPFRKWHAYDDRPTDQFGVPGIPEMLSQHVLIWDGNDIDMLMHSARQDGGSFAAILVDPVQFREPLAASAKACAEAARKLGALLIFDETKTSIRLGPNGLQKQLGVTADITVIGKALGNGFPISAVLSRDDILAQAARCKIKGTYNGETCSMSAALATLSCLQAQPRYEQRLAALGTRMIDGFNTMAATVGVAKSVRAVPYRWAAMPNVYFRTDATRATQLSVLFSSALLARRIVWLPNHMNYIMVAHNEGDIDCWLAACEDVLTTETWARELRGALK